MLPLLMVQPFFVVLKKLILDRAMLKNTDVGLKIFIYVFSRCMSVFIAATSHGSFLDVLPQFLVLSFPIENAEAIRTLKVVTIGRQYRWNANFALF
jgi:hypothetical protein